MKNLIAVLMLSISHVAYALNDDGLLGLRDLMTRSYVQKIDGKFTPSNRVQLGLNVTPTMFEGNNIDYTLIGVLGMPSVQTWQTNPHISNYRTVIGVQGSVYKATPADAVGLKCSIFDTAPGGTSTCLTISFPYPQEGTPTAGILLEGSTWASGLLGIEVDNPQSYKHSINLNGSRMAMGSKSGVVYCLRFNDITAELEYIKDCGSSAEIVVGTLTITPKVIYARPAR